ncbi:hypothetical protein WJX77_005329 [Trebouxia sp. C0004]
MDLERNSSTLQPKPVHRQPKFPGLQHALSLGSSFHGLAPPLRNKKQALGHSRLCYCKQKGQPPSAGPDISLLRLELQRQWHHAKNQHLGDRQITASSEYDTARNGVGPEQVLPRSNKMVFWKDASGHTWAQTPAKRTKPEIDRRKRAAVRARLK